MRTYIKIKDHENLVKDPQTGAILNTDNNALVRHEMRMREIEKEKRKEEEINNLKSELSDIKALLQKLIDG
jgi:tetrahydromethanopterin S-methyltransferase subunit B